MTVDVGDVLIGTTVPEKAEPAPGAAAWLTFDLPGRRRWAPPGCD
ncbi:hypothetical protein ONA91_31345 [Micromonospora sp. DR5-3]|nr:MULTISPECIES: hypothetical protein [unclassified Micromonospora]MCW3818944.1 hypothetical protein [Micromonospora sp. DR5-3]